MKNYLKMQKVSATRRKVAARATWSEILKLVRSRDSEFEPSSQSVRTIEGFRFYSGFHKDRTQTIVGAGLAKNLALTEIYQFIPALDMYLVQERIAIVATRTGRVRGFGSIREDGGMGQLAKRNKEES
ncbi:MAG: hypothetical protein SWY16_15745 [Cyanobacteriota bacterium]|nr:hypothetical protein [Cyanobacteriota bacterium]